MSGDDARTDAKIIDDAFEDRVRDLFKVLAEALYTGEPERAAVERFRRGLVSARKARAMALEAAAPAAAPP